MNVRIDTDERWDSLERKTKPAAFSLSFVIQASFLLEKFHKSQIGELQDLHIGEKL